MNYLQQVYKIQSDYWRYIIGIIIAIVGYILFSMPHIVAIVIERLQGGLDLTRMNDQSYVLSIFDPNLNFVFILLPFAGGLLFLLLIARILHRQSFKSLTTARKKIDWKRFWVIFFAWGIVSSGMVMMDYFSNPEGYVWNFEADRFIILVIIGVLLVPLQTSFEEYLFRGYLMQGIARVTKSSFIPLILTSAIFGLLHIANPEIEKLGYILLVYYIGTGLFLGIMTLMDDGMELALGFHAANNLFTALLVTSDWTAFQTHSIFKNVAEPTTTSFMEIFFPVFVMFPILLLILGKMYSWKNWKQKLFGKVLPPSNEDYKVLD